jgi:hypothetical protein
MPAAPPLSNHVLPLIFYYHPEQTFVLNMILFAQTLTITPHLSLGGISEMVYEHLLGCFIPKDPSSRFLELFQAAIIVACGNIFRLMALVLKADKLLAMVKDIKGLCPIVIGEVFF